MGRLKAAWIYIGRLEESTTKEDIEAFLTDNGIVKIIDCEELQTRGLSKAFKIGIPFDQKEVAYNPNLWPTGIVIRPFRF
jgi:hypothetical protein